MTQGSIDSARTEREPARARSRRDLNASLKDGAGFSAMVGLGETYVPAFALVLGLGDVVAGLVSTVPHLAGAALQLVTPYAVARLGSLRAWVVLAATVQAASFAPLILGAVFGSLDAIWLYLTMALYFGAGLSTGPAWNLWIETLVPRKARASFFARRNRLNNAALLVGLLAGGFALESATAHQSPLVGFAAIFALAAVARGLSARWLAQHSEGPLEASRLPTPRAVRRSLRSSSGLLLAYLAAVQFAVYVSAPFFTPFMLRSLELPYAQFTILTAAALAARVLALPFLGRRAHLDARPLLVAAGIGIAPISWLWTLSDSLGWLLLLQLYSGCAWAAYELATLLLFFDAIPRSERVGTLTLFNLANAAALLAGSLTGAALLGSLGAGGSAYELVFTASSILRLFAALLLVRLFQRVPAVDVHEVAQRTVTVRPAGGGAQPPVLPTLEPD